MSRQRIMILGLSVLAYCVFLMNSTVMLGGILLIILSILCAWILYKNLTSITNIEERNPQFNVMKSSMRFCAIMLIFGIIAALLVHFQIIKTEEQEKWIAAIFVIIIMIGLGYYALNIPFNRHIGLRLPWIMLNEDAWFVANHLLGYLSIPLSIMYLIALPLYNDFEKLTLIIMMTWIGLPAIASFIRVFLKAKY